MGRHKGYKVSKETKEKMSKARSGKYHTEEAKKKISKAHLGKTFSEEHKKKISEALKGDKNNSWKGGITPKNTKIRNSIELRLWRESVFARDNWTCQKCKKRGDVLNAHHIKPFADYPELRTSIENGITLCKECHKKIHRKVHK